MQRDYAHAQLLEGLARKQTDRTISEDEIHTTLEFSGYRNTGGITVLLQQPRRFHPYWKGLEVVVDTSRTFAAVVEAFSAASCGTISIKCSNLSIIDSLPYVRPQDDLSSEDKLRIRQIVSHIIMKKDPDVVLCMWQQAEDKEVTGTMSKFRSLGSAVILMNEKYFSVPDQSPKE